MSIVVSNLNFSYTNPVLEGVSFSIHEGEFVGVFGPNGGGKTTLLKLLLGLLHPEQGSVSLMGGPPEKVSQKIGYVPQMGTFDPLFPITALEVVLQGLLYESGCFFSRELKERAIHAIDHVGLKNKKDYPLGTLSGGERQRILIARALVTKPYILFLDEATSGVDVRAQEKIYETLQRFKGAFTTLFVTHELHSLLEVGCVDRFLCVQKNVVEYTPEELRRQSLAGLYREERGD